MQKGHTCVNQVAGLDKVAIIICIFKTAFIHLVYFLHRLYFCTYDNTLTSEGELSKKFCNKKSRYEWRVPIPTQRFKNSLNRKKQNSNPNFFMNSFRAKIFRLSLLITRRQTFKKFSWKYSSTNAMPVLSSILASTKIA